MEAAKATSTHSSRNFREPLCMARPSSSSSASLRPVGSAPPVPLLTDVFFKKSATCARQSSPTDGILFSLARESGGREASTEDAVASTSLQRTDSGCTEAAYLQFCCSNEKSRLKPVLTPISMRTSVPDLTLDAPPGRQGSEASSSCPHSVPLSVDWEGRCTRNLSWYLL